MTRLVTDPYDGIDWTSVTDHKAQFHTHTTHAPTDGHSGEDPPQAVIDAYHGAGYSVLVLNEHEYNVEETTWPWTDLESLAGGEAHEDRHPADLGMVAIEGCELSPVADDGVQHDLLSLYSDLADTSERSLDDTLSTIGERGGIAVFPHPGRYHESDDWEFYTRYFDEHPHALGVEVYNARGRYPDSEAIWDRLLAHYAPDRAVWGFACDDYHGTDDYGFDTSRTVLLLEDLTPESVREAIENGRSVFQHRTGDDPDAPPAIDAIEIDETAETITVAATGADRIEWISEGSVVTTGETLAYGDAQVGSYARATLHNRQGETGTQPFAFRDG